MLRRLQLPGGPATSWYIQTRKPKPPTPMTASSGAITTVKKRKLRNSSVRVDGGTSGRLCKGEARGWPAWVGLGGRDFREPRIERHCAMANRCLATGTRARVIKRSRGVGRNPSQFTGVTRKARSVCQNYRPEDYEAACKTREGAPSVATLRRIDRVA